MGVSKPQAYCQELQLAAGRAMLSGDVSRVRCLLRKESEGLMKLKDLRRTDYFHARWRQGRLSSRRSERRTGKKNSLGIDSGGPSTDRLAS
jgi:hypothetical protein